MLIANSRKTKRQTGLFCIVTAPVDAAAGLHSGRWTDGVHHVSGCTDILQQNTTEYSPMIRVWKVNLAGFKSLSKDPAVVCCSWTEKNGNMPSNYSSCSLFNTNKYNVETMRQILTDTFIPALVHLCWNTNLLYFLLRWKLIIIS